MLGLADTGLNWLYAYKISDIFKQQLGREQSPSPISSPSWMRPKGGASFPSSMVRYSGCWLVAHPPIYRPCACCWGVWLKRLTETQAGSHLTELPSPLIRKDPNWKKKIESISRIMRLVIPCRVRRCFPSWRRFTAPNARHRGHATGQANQPEAGKDLPRQSSSGGRVHQQVVPQHQQYRGEQVSLLAQHAAAAATTVLRPLHHQHGQPLETDDSCSSTSCATR